MLLDGTPGLITKKSGFISDHFLKSSLLASGKVCIPCVIVNLGVGFLALNSMQITKSERHLSLSMPLKPQIMNQRGKPVPGTKGVDDL